MNDELKRMWKEGLHGVISQKTELFIWYSACLKQVDFASWHIEMHNSHLC
jgi:hypothetical protein